MRSVIIALLLVAALAANTVQEFNISISGTAEERWTEIIKVKGEAIRKTFPQIIKLYRNSDPTIFNKIASNLISRNLHSDFQNEVRVISKLANIDYRTALLANLVYEILAFGCTSIIALDSWGRPWLGRNLDYHVPDFIATLVVKINWQNNGKTEFITDHFAGMVGATTGMKPNQFAISINERKSSTFEQNMARVLHKDYESPMITVLKTLKTAGNYDQALNMLSTAKIMAPCYFNIAGINPNQGAILVRDFNGVVDKHTLADEKSNFFIVQTNDDLKKQCIRKDTAIKNLGLVGKNNMNGKTMVEKVLAEFPTKNQMTVFSVAYCPDKNERVMQMWL